MFALWTRENTERRARAFRRLGDVEGALLARGEIKDRFSREQAEGIATAIMQWDMRRLRQAERRFRRIP